MSVTLWTALLLQLSSVILLRYRLGKTWLLRRPVPLLVLASVVYQGVSPVLLSFPSVGKWDIYRQGVAQQYIDQATLIMSGGMLALTVCYLLTRPERVMAVPAPDGVQQAARVLDWRLSALACLPLAVLTYSGRGYNNGTLITGAGAPLSSVLASTFFVLLMVLAAFAFLLRHGGRWFVPVLAAQSVLLAAAGERTPLLADAIVLSVLLASTGHRPSGRQVGAAAGLTVVAILAITGVRAEQGRDVYYRDSGLGARIGALASGITSAGGTSPTGGPGLLAEGAVRLDGTDFAGAILQARHLGQPRLSAAGVPESLLLVIPSSAWPAKLDHAARLDPLLTEQEDFALRPVNFVPGMPGLYFGFLTPAWLIVFLAGLGLACGRAERRLLASWSPARLVMLAGASLAALATTGGIPAGLVTLRAAVVLAVAIRLAAALLGRAIPSTGRQRWTPLTATRRQRG